MTDSPSPATPDTTGIDDDGPTFEGVVVQTDSPTVLDDGDEVVTVDYPGDREPALQLGAIATVRGTRQEDELVAQAVETDRVEWTADGQAGGED